MAPRALKSYNSKRRRPSSTMHQDSMLHLELKGIDLHNVATGRLVSRASSPIFVVRSAKGEVVATSTRMPHTLNPCWPLITIPCVDLCCCDLDQGIKIEVYDQDDQGDKTASMGWVSTSVRSVLKRQAGRFPLLRDDHTPAGKVEIVIAMIEIRSRVCQSIVLENVPQMPVTDEPASNKQHQQAQDSFNEARLRLVLQGVDLAPVPVPGKGTSDKRKPNRFFRITRFQPGRVKAFEEAYTSEVVPESDSPVWDEATISLAQLCDEDRHMPILLSVWEEPTSGRGMLDMGSCQTTVAELLRTRAQTPKTLTLMQARKNMGTLLVKEAHIVGTRRDPARWIRRNTVSLVSALGQFRNRASQRAQHELGASNGKTKKDEGSLASTIPELSVSIDTSSSVSSESTDGDSVSSSESEGSMSISSLIDSSDSSSSDSSSLSFSDHSSKLPSGSSTGEMHKISLSEESMRAHALYVESLPRYQPSRVESILQNMPKWDLDGDSVVGDNRRYSYSARTSVGKDRESHQSSTPSLGLGRKATHKEPPMASVVEAFSESKSQRNHSAHNLSRRHVPCESPKALASIGSPPGAASRKQPNVERSHKYTSFVGRPKRTRSRFAAARGEPIHRTSEECRNLNRTLGQFTKIAHNEREAHPCHRSEDDELPLRSTGANWDTLAISCSNRDERRGTKGNNSRKVLRSRLDNRKKRSNKTQNTIGRSRGGKKRLNRRKQGSGSNRTRMNTENLVSIGKGLKSIRKVVFQAFLRFSTDRDWGSTPKCLAERKVKP